jgi:RNA polymerase sigma-70 factor, ECF subfamily
VADICRRVQAVPSFEASDPHQSTMDPHQSTMARPNVASLGPSTPRWTREGKHAYEQCGPTSQFSSCQITRCQTFTASSKSSDADLIARIASGDKSAMKDLYARHNAKLFRFVLRLVGDNVLAEDVTSRTFLDVWRQAGAFKGRSSVPTWLLGIARDRSIATVRRRSYAGDVDAGESIKDSGDNPAISLQRMQQCLIDCLANLSAEHREIIDLVYYHQSTIDEIAEIIHVPRNTATIRMLHARQNLASLLSRRRRPHPHLSLLKAL